MSFRAKTSPFSLCSLLLNIHLHHHVRAREAVHFVQQPDWAERMVHLIMVSA